MSIFLSFEESRTGVVDTYVWLICKYVCIEYNSVNVLLCPYTPANFYKRLYQLSLWTKFKPLGASVMLGGPLLVRYETLRARRSRHDPSPSQHPSVAKPRPLDDA